MRNPAADLDDTTGLVGPPWTRPRTVYFYGGWLSNFAPTPGLELPYGYCGHHAPGLVDVRSVEHWFQACKATSRREFDQIMASPTAAGAKRGGRSVALRADWEQVKYDVMLRALAGKFAAEPYRSGLLVTVGRPLAENSPTDFVWGARDPQGGYCGQNLLGQALMAVRAALVADTSRKLGVVASGRRSAAAAVAR